MIPLTASVIGGPILRAMSVNRGTYLAKVSIREAIPAPIGSDSRVIASASAGLANRLNRLSAIGVMKPSDTLATTGISLEATSANAGAIRLTIRSVVGAKASSSWALSGSSSFVSSSLAGPSMIAAIGRPPAARPATAEAPREATAVPISPPTAARTGPARAPTAPTMVATNCGPARAETIAETAAPTGPAAELTAPASSPACLVVLVSWSPTLPNVSCSCPAACCPASPSEPRVLTPRERALDRPRPMPDTREPTPRATPASARGRVPRSTSTLIVTSPEAATFASSSFASSVSARRSPFTSMPTSTFELSIAASRRENSASSAADWVSPSRSNSEVTTRPSRRASCCSARVMAANRARPSIASSAVTSSRSHSNSSARASASWALKPSTSMPTSRVASNVSSARLPSASWAMKRA